MVLLTATPHSGDDTAFYRLLGLLDRSFEGLQAAPRRTTRRSATGCASASATTSCNGVGRHRRVAGVGAVPQTRDPRAHLQAHRRVGGLLQRSARLLRRDGRGRREQRRAQRLNFWGTLALLRCAASSPMAAVLALRTRAGRNCRHDERGELLDRLFDGDSDASSEDDVEPPVAHRRPRACRARGAGRAPRRPSGRPQAQGRCQSTSESCSTRRTTPTTRRLLPLHHHRALPRAGTSGSALAERHRGVITGELPAEERRGTHRGSAMPRGAEYSSPPTACPKASTCRTSSTRSSTTTCRGTPPATSSARAASTASARPAPPFAPRLMYGINNPIDGAVLEVILRKAERIRQRARRTGALPDEGHSLTQALLKSSCCERKGHGETTPQTAFPTMSCSSKLFEEGLGGRRGEGEAEPHHLRAAPPQARRRPARVAPKSSRRSVGGKTTSSASPIARSRAWVPASKPAEARLQGAHGALPEEVRERLEAGGPERDTCASTSATPRRPTVGPCSGATRWLRARRDAPRTQLERRRADLSSPSVLGRVGCWVSDAVTTRTTLALLRLRHQLVIRRGRRDSTLLVEEATGLAWAGQTGHLRGADALALLNAPPSADVPPHVREREAAKALALLGDRTNELEAFAKERADALLDDHLRVRAAAYRDEKAETRERSAQVEALPGPDLIGVFVLLPKVG
jgi:hypothetical protein